jgi:hypothetical protein
VTQNVTGWRFGSDAFTDLPMTQQTARLHPCRGTTDMAAADTLAAVLHGGKPWPSNWRIVGVANEPLRIVHVDGAGLPHGDRL